MIYEKLSIVLFRQSKGACSTLEGLSYINALKILIHDYRYQVTECLYSILRVQKPQNVLEFAHKTEERSAVLNFHVV